MWCANEDFVLPCSCSSALGSLDMTMFPKPGIVNVNANRRGRRVARACLGCGVEIAVVNTEIKRGRGKYCSLACWYSSKKKSKSRKCRECGKMFANINALLYCGKECFLARSTRIKTAKCAACGKEFVRKYPASRVKHCSLACMGMTARDPLIFFTCMHCRKECSHREMGGRRRKFCSKDCQHAHNVAENSALYRGNRRRTRGATWPRQSRLARERDHNTCQGCGLVTKYRACIDHIVPFRLTVVYAQTDNLDPNDILNLVALCRACHGRKTQAENRLLAGDLVGFLAEIRAFLPMDRVEVALNLWGLGQKKKISLPFEPMPNFVYTERHIWRNQ